MPPIMLLCRESVLERVLLSPAERCQYCCCQWGCCCCCCRRRRPPSGFAGYRWPYAGPAARHAGGPRRLLLRRHGPDGTYAYYRRDGVQTEIGSVPDSSTGSVSCKRRVVSSGADGLKIRPAAESDGLKISPMPCSEHRACTLHIFLQFPIF